MTFLFHQTFYTNCIPINPDQCSFMILGVKNELQTDFASNNFTIKNSKEENVLEITFDNNLNISTHLTSSTKQANIKLNALNRVQKCMAPEHKTFLTSSFIKSQFNYCFIISMFCSMKTFHRLNINERSMRLIHQYYFSNFIKYLVNANEESIHQKIIKFLMIEVYKYLNQVK